MKDKYRVIYKPKGAALEYSQLAVNLYIGCEHGCKYCFAPACMFKKRQDYTTDIHVRAGVIDKLEKDLKEMQDASDTRRVLLCFITDPYQKEIEFNHITTEALELFNKYNINFQMLTKGGMKATRDFGLYRKGDAYAASLTFYDKAKSLEWEPKAALPNDRLESIKQAHEQGIETWVSFEPVIEPEETYKLFEASKDYVDLYKIGKINNYKMDKQEDWATFTKTIIKMCEENGKKYYIKDSLKKYM